jgi:hypothetical protein
MDTPLSMLKVRMMMTKYYILGFFVHEFAIFLHTISEESESNCIIRAFAIVREFSHSWQRLNFISSHR